jgi:hypothetical protein
MFSVRNTTYTVHTPTAFRHSIHCCQKDYRPSKDVQWGVYTSSLSPSHVVQEWVL